jgi:hypothetical protein
MLAGSLVSVMRLCHPLYYVNHTCVIDDFFTSPKLMETLLERGMYTVGTIWQGWQGFLTPLNCENKD